MKKQSIEQAYRLAKEQYAHIGVNVDRAMAQLARIPISLHCWQGDDVGGYEKVGAELPAAVFKLPVIIPAGPGRLMNCGRMLRRP